MPKRHATRPPPSLRRSSQPAPPSLDDEAPEIILVDDDDPEIHVVPNAPMAPSMRDALSEWRAVTSKRFPKPPIPLSDLALGPLPLGGVPSRRPPGDDD